MRFSDGMKRSIPPMKDGKVGLCATRVSSITRSAVDCSMDTDLPRFRSDRRFLRPARFRTGGRVEAPVRDPPNGRSVIVKGISSEGRTTRVSREAKVDGI